MLNEIIVGYLLFFNILGFVLMGIDKRKAKKNQWRIREKTLFMISIIGGSFGTLAGMYFFKHKIKHLKFQFGFWIFFIFHISILIYLYLKFSI